MADNDNKTKKPGLLGNKKRRDFQMAPTPTQPYTGGTAETKPAAAAEQPKGIDYEEMLNSKRQSIVVPALNKLEFDALLKVSEDYFYSYELLAEIVYQQVQTLPEDLKQKYNDTLEELKSKEIKKLERKDKKAGK